jgi:hypothetical protein
MGYISTNIEEIDHKKLRMLSAKSGKSIDECVQFAIHELVKDIQI